MSDEPTSGAEAVKHAMRKCVADDSILADDRVLGVLASAAVAALATPAASPATDGWPIATDDEVEALARACDWNNRRYMTPADYAIWCERMRKFARLANPSPAPAAETWRDLDDARLKRAIDAFYDPCEGTTIDGIRNAILAWERG